ncbi:YbjN domain-containing protein [soil metagenome]
MTALQQIQSTPHPLDRVEELAEANDWVLDRTAEDEVNLIVGASHGDLQLSLSWRSDFESLHVACAFDLKVPPLRREEVGRLVNRVNELLLFGHFDLWRDEGSVIFREGLVLAGGAGLTDEQCETLIHVALDSCARYYPAFQFVIWAGKAADEAIAACLFETVGEA